MIVSPRVEDDIAKKERCPASRAAFGLASLIRLLRALVDPCAKETDFCRGERSCGRSTAGSSTAKATTTPAAGTTALPTGPALATAAGATCASAKSTAAASGHSSAALRKNRAQAGCGLLLGYRPALVL